MMKFLILFCMPLIVAAKVVIPEPITDYFKK